MGGSVAQRLFTCAAFGALTAVAACGFTGIGTAGVTSDGADATTNGAAADARVESDASDIELGHEDGSVDAAGDAGADADACPAACTKCSKDGRCEIECGASCPKTITCPPGIPCRVRCTGKGNCSGAIIDCLGATSCDVECTRTEACVGAVIRCGGGKCRVACGGEDDSCVGLSIQAATAAAFCLECRGDPGCRDLACSAAAGCTKSCASDGCSGNDTGCGACGDVPSCPPP